MAIIPLKSSESSKNDSTMFEWSRLAHPIPMDAAAITEVNWRNVGKALCMYIPVVVHMPSDVPRGSRFLTLNKYASPFYLGSTPIKSQVRHERHRCPPNFPVGSSHAVSKLLFKLIHTPPLLSRHLFARYPHNPTSRRSFGSGKKQGLLRTHPPFETNVQNPHLLQPVTFPLSNPYHLCRVLKSGRLNRSTPTLYRAPLQRRRTMGLITCTFFLYFTLRSHLYRVRSLRAIWGSVEFCSRVRREDDEGDTEGIYWGLPRRISTYRDWSCHLDWFEALNGCRSSLRKEGR